MEQKLIFRGRPVTSQDLNLIRSLVDQYQQQGQTFISKELCRIWNWHQPNGALKDMACRELLRRLEQKGLLRLPPKKIDIDRRQKKRSLNVLPHETHSVTGRLKEFLPIELKMVRGSPDEALSNSLIHQYHYLGYRQTVGPCLKYMALCQRTSHRLPFLGSSRLEGRLPGSVHRMVPFHSKQQSFLHREQHPFLNLTEDCFMILHLTTVLILLEKC